MPPPQEARAAERQEFHWIAEVETAEELRLLPLTPEEEEEKKAAEAAKAPPPRPEPGVLLRRQVAELMRPLLWAVAYVGFILGVRAWVG